MMSLQAAMATRAERVAWQSVLARSGALSAAGVATSLRRPLRYRLHHGCGGRRHRRRPCSHHGPAPVATQHEICSRRGDRHDAGADANARPEADTDGPATRPCNRRGREARGRSGRFRRRLVYGSGPGRPLRAGHPRNAFADVGEVRVVEVPRPVRQVRRLHHLEDRGRDDTFDGDRDQALALAGVVGLGPHPVGLDRALGPHHHHAFGGLELGLDHLVPGFAGADAGVPPNRPALGLQGLDDRAHLLTILALVAQENIGHAPTRLPFWKYGPVIASRAATEKTSCRSTICHVRAALGDRGRPC